MAYGTPARIALTAIKEMRAEGMKVGLVRPITLWPFPSEVLEELASRDMVKGFLAVEMSEGQMVEDVRLIVNGRKPVEFYGRTGGFVINTEELISVVEGGKR